MILVVSVASLLSACTTTTTTSADEARVEKLLRHPSWPRIQQIATTGQKTREAFGLA